MSDKLNKTIYEERINKINRYIKDRLEEYYNVSDTRENINYTHYRKVLEDLYSIVNGDDEKLKEITMYDLFGLINDGNIPEIISIGGEIYNLDYSKEEIQYKSRNTGFWLNYSWYIEKPKRLSTKLYILKGGDAIES